MLRDPRLSESAALLFFCSAALDRKRSPSGRG
jgi:hypothetical protein